MSDSILNSITNSNDITVYDEIKPYSFLHVLKFYNSNIDTKDIITAYNNYIQKWCETKYNQYDINVYKEIIRQQYIALLKEIELEYSSAEEQRFLNLLTFDDDILNDNSKLDNLMDIAIPFYIEKINNICKYYIDKRSEYKFNIQNDKVICSPNAIADYVKNIILDEINTNIGDYQSIPVSSLELLPQILSVDVVNLYDHNDYFDKTVTYDANNTNNINYKAFYDFDDAIIDAIRQYPFYLIESGIFSFSVNPQLTSDDINYLPVKDFIDQYKSADKNDTVITLQKELVEKFSGADYYYIRTDENNNPVSGILIEAENDILNILNVDILNTPTIDSGVYDDIRRIGLNFTPDKFGLLFYNTNNLKYEIDLTKLQANSIYVFPDPNRFSRNDIPMVWFVDVNNIKLNHTSQYGTNRPTSDPLSQYFYSYFSTNQKQDSQNTRSISFKDSFESLYNKGIIYQYKFDIYGNEYAVFKKDDYYKNPKIDSGLYDNPYSSSNSNIDENAYINRILDGNIINAPYYTSLPLNTDLSEVVYYYLKMGYISTSNFDNMLSTNMFYHNNILVDGDKIVYDNNLFSHNTDIPGWYEKLSNISYNTLLDAGIAGYVTTGNGPYAVKTPINSLLSGEANITLNDYNTTYDGGYWFTNGYKDKKDNIDPDYGVVIADESNTILEDIPNVLSANSIINNINLSGTFYFKNAYTGDIILGSDALSAMYSKYNVDGASEEQKLIYQELISNNIKDIDVIDDVIFVTTSNYIVFDKIIWNDNQIQKSIYNTNYIALNNDTNNNDTNVQYHFDKPSTYFYLEKQKRVVYIQMTPLAGFDNVYYPVLKQINLDTLHIDELNFKDAYPSWLATEFDWGVLKNDYSIVRISKPLLVYNSLNNLYNLNMFCYTSTGLPYYYNISFTYNVNDIILYSNRFYTLNNTETVIEAEEVKL